MALSISNLTPQQSALSKYTNPQPFSFLKNYGTGNAFLGTSSAAGNPTQTPNMSTPAGPAVGGVGKTFTNAPQTGLVQTGSGPAGAAMGSNPAPPPVAKPVAQSTVSKTVTPSPMTGLTTPSGIPITGDPATYSGINPPGAPNSGGSPSAYSASNPPTYPGLVSTLANTSTTPPPAYTQASQGLLNNASSDPLTSGAAYDTYSKAVQNLNDLQAKYQSTLKEINTSGVDLQLGTGEQQALATEYAGQLDAAQQAVTQAQAALGYGVQEQQTQQAGFTSALGGANTQQGLQQSGLTSAIGASTPQVAGFNQQTFNPLTQSFSSGNGGAGTLSPEAQGAVTLQIQKVKSGNSTIADAEGALTSYGQPAVNALQAGLGPGFNTIQSNANAASQSTNLQNTSSQSQATSQAVDYANKVLDDLTTAYNAQGSLQKTGIPLVNAGATLLSQLTGFGISATQGYTSATGEAVAAVSQALASGGITPTSAGMIATALVPPNATPEQIVAAKSYLQTFLSQRQSTYTQPPAAAQYGGSAPPVPAAESNPLYDY